MIALVLWASTYTLVIRDWQPLVVVGMQHLVGIWLEILSLLCYFCLGVWNLQTAFLKNTVCPARRVASCLWLPWHLYFGSTTRRLTFKNCPLSWRILAWVKAKPFLPSRTRYESSSFALISKERINLHASSRLADRPFDLHAYFPILISNDQHKARNDFLCPVTES